MVITKLWGAHEVNLTPFSFQFLKIKNCLRDLQGISGKVIDIGCGGGSMAKAIKKERPDIKVYGLDSNRRAIEAAKLNPGRVVFVFENAAATKFPSSYFDAVVMFDVLEHIANPQAVLREIRRVLKPGGLFHIFIPLEAEPLTLYFIALKKLGWKAKVRQSGHIRKYSFKSMKSLLGRNNFKIVGRYFSNHLIFQTTDLLFHLAWELIPSLKPKVSVETFFSSKTSSVKFILAKFIKNLFSLAFWVESAVFQNFPGGGVGISAVKIK